MGTREIAFLILIGSAFAFLGCQRTLKLPYRAEVIHGEMFITVYAHDIETQQGMIPCWSYVSQGFIRHGQQELVFTLRRPPGNDEKDFPIKLFEMFKTIFSYAEKGRLVHAGGYTIFNPNMPFLGHRGKWGLIYLPCQSHPNVEIAPNALEAVLIKGAETELIQKVGYYRIATSLGAAYRYYPCPPWSDPARKPVISVDDYEKSVLSKVPCVWTRGLMVRLGAKAQVSLSRFGRSWQDLLAEQETEIILRVQKDAVPQLNSFLSSLPNEGPIALLTEPDLGADVRLSWSSASGETLGIFPLTGSGSWMTGSFLIFNYGKEIPDGGNVVEDGFYMGLSSASWKRLKSAIASGQPIAIPASKDGLSLKVEYF